MRLYSWTYKISQMSFRYNVQVDKSPEYSWYFSIKLAHNVSKKLRIVGFDWLSWQTSVTLYSVGVLHTSLYSITEAGWWLHFILLSLFRPQCAAMASSSKHALKVKGLPSIYFICKCLKRWLESIRDHEVLSRQNTRTCKNSSQ